VITLTVTNHPRDIEHDFLQLLPGDKVCFMQITIFCHNGACSSRGTVRQLLGKKAFEHFVGVSSCVHKYCDADIVSRVLAYATK
jgi:hypothetical protein